MKRTTRKILRPAALLTAIIAVIGILQAADDPAPTPTVPQPTREELREQLKNLSPAEREAKLKEFREKYGQSSPQRELWQKRRDELKNLSPEEREAKIREWRQQSTTNAPASRGMTLEERQARLKAIRARLEAQLTALRTNSTLTPEEKRRLERLEDMARRFQVTNATPAAPERPAPVTGPEKPEKAPGGNPQGPSPGK